MTATNPPVERPGVMQTLTHEPGGIVLHEGRAGISNPILGMLLFITSEIMFFGGLFAAYFNVRAAAPVWPPAEFQDKLHLMPLVLPATIILISSSATVQLGVWSIRKGDRTGFTRGIALTLVMGLAFLVMQMGDYIILYSEGLKLDSGPFGSTYFTLTGFHMAHVLAGTIMLAVVLYRGMSGQFSARHHDAVEATSLYWHFVDVVWIVLFSILYLLPGH
jgi:cytochrome c oxidase subunit 3